jgi:hypothetical protein
MHTTHSHDLFLVDIRKFAMLFSGSQSQSPESSLWVWWWQVATLREDRARLLREVEQRDRVIEGLRRK